MIYILMGETSSGKDYILKNMVEQNIQPIVSLTSRPMRDGEAEGVEYYFTDKNEFLNMIKEDELIEYRKYNTLVNGIEDTWYYGLKKQKLDNDKDYVVILDVQGAKDFIKHYGTDICKLIYIYCPKEERIRRAKIRGGYDEVEFARRLEADAYDFRDKVLNEMNVITVLNDGSENIENIIKKIYLT